MASTYSPNLRLELIGTGDQQGTWGATTNTNLGTLLEEAIGGYVSVTVSDVADTTLTTNNGSADQSRNAVINLTGALTNTRNVICPAIEKVYIVRNATTGGFAVTFKVSGQTGVSVPNGATYLVYVNGTDAIAVTGTMAAQLASAVAITGGSIVANASSLSVRDSDGSHVLTFAVGSNLTANTTLTLTTGTSNRTLDISSANVTISTAGAALIDDADASAQRTTLGLGTIATQNSNNVSITGGSVTGITDLAVADGGTGASDAATARTNLGIGTIGTQNANNVTITGGSITGITDLAVADGGTGASDASGARTNLGLGTISTQNSNNVTITGGSISGITDLAVADGGTGASDASTARTNLGLGSISTQNSNNVSITGGSVTGITDLALADGGTGASLSDPNADAVLGWNDTAGTMRFFTAGTGISIDAATNTIASTITAGGDYVMQSYVSPATWTKPAGLKAVKVTVVGGGGGTATASTSNSGGGGGGTAIEYIDAPAIPGPVAVTVGAGGTSAAPQTGGTSSFGTFCSATGGAGGGTGGTGSGGTVNIDGGDGGGTIRVVGTTWTGAGGNSTMGFGAAASSQGPARAGQLYGGGASAAASTAQPPNIPVVPAPGNAGAAGIVIVEEFY